jgi:type I restriction enzyme R subunit
MDMEQGQLNWIANFIWGIADDVLRDLYVRGKYRVSADTAYQNARMNSDKQNARIEHEKALVRAMTAVMKDDTELFKQFMDKESFKRWLSDTVFGLTYGASG